MRARKARKQVSYAGSEAVMKAVKKQSRLALGLLRYQAVIGKQAVIH